ncbi:DUF3572 domain-containing protein [Jannaschia sp. W003]|uniref:DUF3572 domain-containing protein n=1 Tax=Jannaschia sp. W003 TaxID=2867012 RepID=UPI0021A649C8|nr:DUF3572 domain-containing protein [Jannaschia sp. W003]UWQ21162.1 DUF3572 domain-containing protein [Jannaschia sp. W003]
MIARDRAEVVAIGALGWLAGEELLDAFSHSTGIGTNEMGARAEDPEFLGAVLDFVLGRDDWVIGAAAAQDLPPEALLEARAALPGGDQHHWT